MTNSPVNLYLYQQLIAKELFSAKAYTSYASKRFVKDLEIYVLSKCLISPVHYQKKIHLERWSKWLTIH